MILPYNKMLAVHVGEHENMARWWILPLWGADSCSAWVGKL